MAIDAEAFYRSVVEGLDRRQALLSEFLDDHVDADMAIRAIDIFVSMLDLAESGFQVLPAAIDSPAQEKRATI